VTAGLKLEMERWTMDKIVIYGLGKLFDHYRKWLESNYEVVGYCDKKISNVGGI
jgi:hypothetical protein